MAGGKAKPAHCFAYGECPLAHKGLGYAPASGPKTARVLIVGEALGLQEALKGTPFIGDAGAQLDKILRLIGKSRDVDVRVDNTCRCKPPNNWLVGAPWEMDAIAHCSSYLDQTLNEGYNVVVPVGGTAIRRMLGFSPKEWKGFKKPIENFHGTIHTDPDGRFWIIPTWHPSFIMQGNHKMTGVMIHDFELAFEVAENGHVDEEVTLEVDPPVGSFNAWVDKVILTAKNEFHEKGERWLAVDIETPEKDKHVDESELEVDDPSYIITRINFAVEWETDFALTIPWMGPYLHGIKRLLRSKFFKKAFWNANYDRPRLIKNKCPVGDPWYDLMDGWHMLQSNLPRGLGFVAPFYSKYGAWKHLSSTDPGLYAAIDALQTVRCAIGIERDLNTHGQWDAYLRHGALMDRYALKPAEEVGIPMKRKLLHEFQKELDGLANELIEGIRLHIPKELLPREPTNGYKKQPVDKETKEPLEGYFPVTSKEQCLKCLACEATDVTEKHRCKEKKFWVEENKGKSPIIGGRFDVTKWFRLGEFNPNSPPQMLKYLHFKGHKPGKNKKTKSDSADADTIDKLYKKTGDPVYGSLLKVRKVTKVNGTYVGGALSQMDDNERVHPIFTNLPSTWRTSSQGFNAQNIIGDKKGTDWERELGKRFRRCIVAQDGCKLIEADYAGIEAVQVGWFAGDPQYIRLANMSTHAFITSHMKDFDDKPAQFDWDDDELRDYLKAIKNNEKYKLMYARAKTIVHGGNYGRTAMGVKLSYPEDFPTEKSAQYVIDLMFDLFPAVKAWKSATQHLAHSQHFLGGDAHPFKYKHWFWDVFKYKRITGAAITRAQQKGRPTVQFGNYTYEVGLGTDSKRCIAYLPQSTAGGVIRDACLRLFTPESEYYIGDVFYGKTPFRMPIHDSLVLEVPNEKVDYTLERLVPAMKVPIEVQPLSWEPGKFLEIGVDVEIGENWGEMEKVA